MGLLAQPLGRGPALRGVGRHRLRHGLGGGHQRPSPPPPHDAPRRSKRTSEMNSLPSLSIVIPTHSRSDLLRVCLSTVVRHKPAGTQVLVIDDASPHGGAAAVARAFPDVQVVASPGRGFCAAVNAGIDHASGAVIEILNDDTQVTAGWAEAALA